MSDSNSVNYAKALIPFFISPRVEGGSVEEYAALARKFSEMMIETGPSYKLLMMKSVTTGSIYKGLPLFKEIIKQVDFDKYFQKVNHFLQPVLKETGVLSLERDERGSIRSSGKCPCCGADLFFGPEGTPQKLYTHEQVKNLEHSAMWIAYLCIACDNKAQLVTSPADLDIDIALLRNTKEHLGNDEARARLASIIRVISAYRWDFQTKMLVPKLGINIQHRLEDILYIGEIQQASECRWFFGIPRKLKLAKAKFARLLKNSFKNETIRSSLRLVTTPISVIHPKVIAAREIFTESIFANMKYYNPPVIPHPTVPAISKYIPAMSKEVISAYPSLSYRY